MFALELIEKSDAQQQSDCKNEPKRSCRRAKKFLHILVIDARSASTRKLGAARQILGASQSSHHHLLFGRKSRRCTILPGQPKVGTRALAASLDSRGITVMRKKKPGIRMEKEARRRARAGIGMPPAQRLIPDKRRKSPKHKKVLLDPGKD